MIVWVLGERRLSKYLKTAYTGFSISALEGILSKNVSITEESVNTASVDSKDVTKNI